MVANMKLDSGSIGKTQTGIFEAKIKTDSNNDKRYCEQHKPGLVAVDFLANQHDDQQTLDEDLYGAYFEELESRKHKIRSTAQSLRDLIVEVKLPMVKMLWFFFTKNLGGGAERMQPNSDCEAGQQDLQKSSDKFP